jgi:hypothetical protein
MSQHNSAHSYREDLEAINHVRSHHTTWLMCLAGLHVLNPSKTRGRIPVILSRGAGVKMKIYFKLYGSLIKLVQSLYL